MRGATPQLRGQLPPQQGLGREETQKERPSPLPHTVPDLSAPSVAKPPFPPRGKARKKGARPVYVKRERPTGPLPKLPAPLPLRTDVFLGLAGWGGKVEQQGGVGARAQQCQESRACRRGGGGGAQQGSCRASEGPPPNSGVRTSGAGPPASPSGRCRWGCRQ